MTVKYFDGNILLPDAEITPSDVEDRMFYNKVYYKTNLPFKSEHYFKNEISSVIYFDKNPSDNKLKIEHHKFYGNIKYQIWSLFFENNIHFQKIYYYNEKGILLSSSIFKGKQEWAWEEEERYSPTGEKWETIKYIYNEAGELVKEIHYRGDGSFWFDEDIESFE